MRFPIGIVIIAVFGILAILAPFAEGGTLREDYRDFVVRRQDLEKERSRYQARINTLKSEQRKLTLDLYKCVVKSGRAEWAQKLDDAQARSDRLEEMRKNLNALRIELGEIRETLENERAAIERRHKRKGPGTEYEKEFRDYMRKLEEQYFQSISVKLFAGYEEYISVISSHTSALMKDIEACSAL